MTTGPDPRRVHEIAEDAMRRGGDRDESVEAALIASGVAGPVLSKKFDVWTRAVGAEYEQLAD